MGVAEGRFQDEVVLPGLLQAVMERDDRVFRGKEMRNFKYSEAYDEFISMVHMVSPQAHSLIAKYMPVRTARSIW